MKTIQEKNGEVEYVLTQEEYRRLHEVNRELLEALKEANAELEYLNDPKGFVSMRQERIMEKARAAITKAQEQK